MIFHRTPLCLKPPNLQLHGNSKAQCFYDYLVSGTDTDFPHVGHQPSCFWIVRQYVKKCIFLWSEVFGRLREVFVMHNKALASARTRYSHISKTQSFFVLQMIIAVKPLTEC